MHVRACRGYMYTITCAVRGVPTQVTVGLPSRRSSCHTAQKWKFAAVVNKQAQIRRGGVLAWLYHIVGRLLVLGDGLSRPIATRWIHHLHVHEHGLFILQDYPRMSNGSTGRMFNQMLMQTSEENEGAAEFQRVHWD